MMRDAGIGLGALVLAIWLAAPGSGPPPTWWLLVAPLALASGPLARRLAARWPGHPALALVAAGSAAALGCNILLTLAGAWQSPNPAFAALHALVLALGLIATRPGRTGRQPLAALLDRPLHLPDPASIAHVVQGRNVLITGAGGSIGAALARQVAALAPSRLTLLDHSEYALWRIDSTLAESHASLPRVTLLADIRDPARIRRIMTEARPDIVLHAAALKHVPITEAQPLEAILTNALGTRVVADAARDAGVGCFVLVSTDKAVNPVSVMGATKRLAEMYGQALDDPRGMRCLAVRFGNVLGSSGSVVPVFRRQIARGMPLTVTHPAMRRYFMTLEEAAGLILRAARLRDAAAGAVFVLDMGAPIRILELARRMLRASAQDLPIRFTGMRPGERLDEEPPTADAQPSREAGVLVATPRPVDAALVGRAIDELAMLAQAGHAQAARERLWRVIGQDSPGLRSVAH